MLDKKSEMAGIAATNLKRTMMRVMTIAANVNVLTAVLVAAVSLSLGSGATAQGQTTNLSSMSLQAWQMPPAQTHGRPRTHPVQINEQNINVASQEAVVNGCAETIEQI